MKERHDGDTGKESESRLPTGSDEQEWIEIDQIETCGTYAGPEQIKNGGVFAGIVQVWWRPPARIQRVDVRHVMQKVHDWPCGEAGGRAMLNQPHPCAVEECNHGYEPGIKQVDPCQAAPDETAEAIDRQTTNGDQGDERRGKPKTRCERSQQPDNQPYRKAEQERVRPADLPAAIKRANQPCTCEKVQHGNEDSQPGMSRRRQDQRHVDDMLFRTGGERPDTCEERERRGKEGQSGNADRSDNDVFEPLARHGRP